MNVVLCKYLIEEVPGGEQMGKMLLDSCTHHKSIVDKFGRYPHRNLALNRATTSEEKAWLADYDSLPAFAKSQLPSKDSAEFAALIAP